MTENPLRRRLRDALTAAMKTRDRTAVAALRATLAAIDNAEAVSAGDPPAGGLAIEQTAVGIGVADVARRVLTPADVERIVRDEIAEREAAAADYDRVGHPERAGRLRDEARVLATHLRHPE